MKSVPTLASLLFVLVSSLAWAGCAGPPDDEAPVAAPVDDDAVETQQRIDPFRQLRAMCLSGCEMNNVSCDSGEYSCAANYVCCVAGCHSF
jgi:hypothetical protein